MILPWNTWASQAFLSGGRISVPCSDQRLLRTTLKLGRRRKRLAIWVNYQDLSQRPHRRWWLVRWVIPKWPYSASCIIVIYPAPWFKPLQLEHSQFPCLIIHCHSNFHRHIIDAFPRNWNGADLIIQIGWVFWWGKRLRCNLAEWSSQRIRHSLEVEVWMGTFSTLRTQPAVMNGMTQLL